MVPPVAIRVAHQGMHKVETSQWTPPCRKLVKCCPAVKFCKRRAASQRPSWLPKPQKPRKRLRMRLSRRWPLHKRRPPQLRLLKKKMTV